MMLKCSVLSFHASAAFAGFQERVDASWESNQKVAASLWKLFPFISRPYFFSKGYSHRVEPCCNMPYRAESSLPLPWNEHSDSCWYNGASKNVYFKWRLSFFLANWSIMSDDIATNPHLLEDQKIFMESPNISNDY